MGAYILKQLSMQAFIAKVRLYISHGVNNNFTIRLYNYIYLMGLVDCMRSWSFILILVMGHAIVIGATPCIMPYEKDSSSFSFIIS